MVQQPLQPPLRLQSSREPNPDPAVYHALRTVAVVVVIVVVDVVVNVVVVLVS